MIRPELEYGSVGHPDKSERVLQTTYRNIRILFHYLVMEVNGTVLTTFKNELIP
jgi:hypothetical protein